MTTCNNCGRVMGNMETPAVWQNYLACAPRHAALAQSIAAQQQSQTEPVYDDPLQAIAAAQRPSAGYQAPAQQSIYRSDINIHYHGGYSGSSRQTKPRSPLITAGVVLLVIAVPFICLFWPVAVVLLIVGAALAIVGAAS